MATVSNRGIARAHETYRVEGRLLLDVDLKATFRQAGVTAKGMLKARDLVVRIVTGELAGRLPGVTVEGESQVSYHARTPGCSGD